MNFEEMSNAYQKAQQSHKDVWKDTNSTSEYREGDYPTRDYAKKIISASYSPSTPKEVDYAIVKLDGGYLVARSRNLGSLDYEVICTCTSHFEAREIVKALNK
jgi:hypothetical protein